MQHKIMSQLCLSTNFTSSAALFKHMAVKSHAETMAMGGGVFNAPAPSLPELADRLQRQSVDHSSFLYFFPPQGSQRRL